MLRRMTRDRYLSDAELGRFMAAVRERRHRNQPRDYALFALLANTGIRPSEARGLERRDVHFGPHPWIRLRRPFTRHGPDPCNELAIPPAVAAVVKAYAAPLDPTAKLFPFTKRQGARLFHYYASKAGVPERFRIYSLRHTAGMRLWPVTRDLRLIQAIMGHARLKASAIYVHTSPADMRAALEAIEARS